MKKIMLFKAENVSDTETSFETRLKHENYDVFSIKTLDFTYFNLETLRKCLQTPEEYSGIIFTSPRCVTSVHKALKGELLSEKWRLSKQNYAVGPKTVECAQTELNLACLGGEAGNALNLAQIIIKHSSAGNPTYTKLPFLYPRGNLAKDLLKNELNASNVSTTDVIVYETVPYVDLEAEIQEATDNFEVPVDFLVFFSPSGVKAVLPHFSRLKHKNLKIIAIGPTTQTALKENSIFVHGTPVAPSVDALVALLAGLP